MPGAGLMMQYDAQKKSVVIADPTLVLRGTARRAQILLGENRIGRDAPHPHGCLFTCPRLGPYPSASVEEASFLIFLLWAGVAVWWLIDFLLVPGILRKYNSQLAQRLGQS